MLSVTGPGPLWTSRTPRRRNPRYKPSPALFAKFARAVATRYGDRVDRYLIWNEPNVAGWLEPQQTCVSRRVCSPASPHHLPRPRARRAAGDRARRPGRAGAARRARAARAPRHLDPQPGLAAAVPARAGVRGPALQAHAPRPVPQLQARARRRLRLPPARRRVRPRGPEPGSRPGPDRRPAAALHGARPAHALGPDRGAEPALRRLPDRVRLPDLAARPPRRASASRRQTRYLQQAAYLAWRLPRVRNLTQYQWRDEPVVARGGGPREYAGWQSGLRYVNDKPKPAFRGFTEPFVIDLPPAAHARALLGPDPAGHRHPHGHRPAPAPRPARVPRASPGPAPTPAASGHARCRSSGARSTASPGSRPPSPPAALPTRRLSGIVSLASDPARQWHASRP